MLLTPAQITPEVFETREKGFFIIIFLPGVSGCVSCLRACLGVRLLPQSYQYGTGLSEGADRVSGGQLRGDKLDECPRIPSTGLRHPFFQPRHCRTSYAMRSRKLSDNEQFFVGAQTVVCLLQTTQITILDVCFITDHVAYASSNKTKIV